MESKGNSTYKYNSDNLLYKVYSGSPDLGAANYYRDLSGRIIQENIEVKDYNSVNNAASLFTLDYKYLNKKNLLDKLSLVFRGTQYTTSFVYGNQNKGENPDVVYGLKSNGTLRLEYDYDKFARLTKRTLNAGSNSILKRYAYKTNTQNNATGHLIDTVTENGYTYKYSYDSLGNITSYSKKYAGTVVENGLYQYDNKGQLTFAGTSATDGITYTYDSNGNILTKHNSSNNTTITYGYTDPTWADLLTSYNGYTITYDTIGNPLTYNNGTAMTFTWANGRNLNTVSKGNSAISYSYDGESNRTSKIVDGAYTQYIVVDGVLFGERRYNNTGYDLIIYLYDENGDKYGFTYNGTEYYYQTNLQGDVVGIYDSTGQLAVQYTYDAWGKLLSATGTLASTIGQINPIRYRGYYYDTETGFYYLQSRYYDPEIGRFINADGYVSTGQGILSYNMFAYCLNDPIRFADDSGTRCVEDRPDGRWVMVTNSGNVVSGGRTPPSSCVGAAKPYVKMAGSNNPTSPNCYAYAIGSSVNEQPGATSGRTPTKWNDVNDVGKSVEADLKAKGHTVRKISGPDAKVYDNEFKIALRVGTQPYAYNTYTGQPYYDYHFMRQTNTGQWAEKHGYGGESILWDTGMTPETIPWTLSGVPYYNSAIIYYAVGD